MYRREQQEHEPSGQRKSSKKAGFVVKNAPWDQSPPSTTDTKAFPAFGDAMDSNEPNNNWGRN